ncbi:MAG: DNA-directed RNA polymerase subunit beta [Candidatus Bipolaricaulota bacterium]|nr:DNA-directed RNA polymerase subunit beta [Candidatus Bipolaricaulota bacterium]MDW8126753.1 DNA-directed RNA polymerase subunit beta [Candidatus Bipolaricaulota bacterium]
MSTRRFFSRVKPRLDPPDFVAHQLQSYERFLREGIPQVFAEVSPIRAPGRDDLYLELVDPYLGEPRYDEWECRDRDLTYAAPLKATGRLYAEGKLRQEAELYLADIPLMTPRGTFIINGTENVIVSELVRSPGLYITQDEPHLFRAHFLPEQGAWLEIELDVRKWTLKARLDRRATVPATTYLRALGLETSEIITRYSVQVSVEGLDELFDRWKAVILAENIPAGDEVWSVGEELTPARAKTLNRLGRTSVRVAHPAIARSLQEEKVASREEAVRLIYSKFRSGERVPLSQAEEYLQRFYFRPDAYHLTPVGRFKINRKLGLNREETCLTPEDVFSALELLLRAPEDPSLLDEPDHLANKRVRLAGEQAQAALREGLLRMARVAEDKLIHLELEEKDLIRRVVSTRTIQAALNSLFYTGRLSQFLEQTNPLAELTHKRRLSALGTVAAAARRAKVEIRDVHPSHYARICPIETPEGQNVGLITSMAVYVRVNEYGFLEAPYAVVKNGRITGEIRYLMADEEEHYRIAPATVAVDKDGRILGEKVLVRTGSEEFRYVSPKEVDFVEVAPNMALGVSAALIPFLEHDDANRALMGANMQRQAVALLRPQAPLVGTGLEGKAARDSGAVVVAEEDGTVVYVDAQKIVVKGKKGQKTYRLRIFERSNQNTVIHQRPIVRKGDKVKKGDVIADSQFSEGGELALGANLLVAFLPFEGFNYEDAIVLSERLVRENLMDSIHIQEFEVRAEDTKLGPEEITADIPNLPRSAMRNLDEHGIVRVGTEVRTGDILVGKITPKGESEPTPEERIFLSIFGERMRSFKNTSLRMPPITGTATVIRVKRLSRAAGDELEAGVNELVKVYVAQRRRIAVGDKLAGRHGNKGVISAILPVEDMPFLPDGTPVDVILNPLGVPSRMNLGQIFETNLGWLASLRGEKVASPPFDGAKEEEILEELGEELRKRGLSKEPRVDGKVILRDGRTGEPFESPVTVGVMYLLKLEHIAAEKIHARSTGPYALITQQPLGGRAHFGGQRLGEMEVWALEAYGAASLLQEMLTLKSDDVRGRVALYKAILRGEDFPRPGIPESFRVLWQELRCLGLSLKAYDKSGRELDII